MLTRGEESWRVLEISSECWGVQLSAEECWRIMDSFCNSVCIVNCKVVKYILVYDV